MFDRSPTVRHTIGSVDLTVLRDVARSRRPTPDLIEDVLRAQLLTAALRPDLDGEALAGLVAGERQLLLQLFSRPARDAEELLLRAAVSRDATKDDDNLVAMMSASLEADCMRLGLAQDPWAGLGLVWQ